MNPHAHWSNEPWLSITHHDLHVERMQCEDEGKDISDLQPEFEALLAADLSLPEQQNRASALLDTTAAWPTKPETPWVEPSDLDAIRAERPAPVSLPQPPNQAALTDRVLGAWLGRCCGCLLGKPVEGRKSWEMRAYLTAQDRWPLDRYFSRTADADVAQTNGFHLHTGGVYEEDIRCMVEDDDTNYTVTGLAIVQQHGAQFTPADVARYWMRNLPILHVCTAERVAYKNLVLGVAPPQSAAYRNVYREWIGAQIRADFFGYANPGRPERAAEWAWRDASISHVKNGIYGEMWVAAMLAAAAVCDDIETVIRAGLAQVPARSRLTAGINRVLTMFHQGATYEQAVDALHARWDEGNGHHWCHTISNAELVTIALLWGERDFGATICKSVMPGYDTDCNGATAGSVLGMMLGASALPTAWTAPLNDTLQTGVAGYHEVSIRSLAAITMECIGAHS